MATHQSARWPKLLPRLFHDLARKLRTWQGSPMTERSQLGPAWAPARVSHSSWRQEKFSSSSVTRWASLALDELLNSLRGREARSSVSVQPSRLRREWRGERRGFHAGSASDTVAQNNALISDTSEELGRDYLESDFVKRPGLPFSGGCVSQQQPPVPDRRSAAILRYLAVDQIEREKGKHPCSRSCGAARNTERFARFRYARQ